MNFRLKVSMMSEAPVTRVKQEIDTTSCCSPSPSTGNNSTHQILYNQSPQDVSVFNFIQCDICLI